MIENYLTTGKVTALTSFAIGTFIFIAYYFTSATECLVIGCLFIAVVAIINFVVLIAILMKLRKNRDSIKKGRITCGLMLLNIPVMLFYCWITLILINTMRITFVNETSAELTEIKIIGCEPGRIDRLSPGESQTIWVDITGDCSIDIEYILNGEYQKESVVGYVTTNGGHLMEHYIGYAAF